MMVGQEDVVNFEHAILVVLLMAEHVIQFRDFAQSVQPENSVIRHVISLIVAKT